MTQERNAAFGDLNDLLDARMDDIDELPPLAVPPTGHYTLTFSMEQKEHEGKEFLAAQFTVIGINSVKDEDQAGEVKVGQQFGDRTYTKTNAGDVNKVGIAALKTRLMPFAISLFGEGSNPTFGEVVEKLQGVEFTAGLVRTARKDKSGEVVEDSYNFRLKDIIVL